MALSWVASDTVAASKEELQKDSAVNFQWHCPGLLQIQWQGLKRNCRKTQPSISNCIVLGCFRYSGRVYRGTAERLSRQFQIALSWVASDTVAASKEELQKDSAVNFKLHCPGLLQIQWQSLKRNCRKTQPSISNGIVLGCFRYSGSVYRGTAERLSRQFQIALSWVASDTVAGSKEELQKDSAVNFKLHCPGLLQIQWQGLKRNCRKTQPSISNCIVLGCFRYSGRVYRGTAERLSRQFQIALSWVASDSVAGSKEELQKDSAVNFKWHCPGLLQIQWQRLQRNCRKTQPSISNCIVLGCFRYSGRV